MKKAEKAQALPVAVVNIGGELDDRTCSELADLALHATARRANKLQPDLRRGSLGRSGIGPEAHKFTSTGVSRV
jgi:hypothetical protein